MIYFKLLKCRIDFKKECVTTFNNLKDSRVAVGSRSTTCTSTVLVTFLYGKKNKLKFKGV